MRRIIPLSVLALLLATAGSAFADRRHDGRDNRRNDRYSQRDRGARVYHNHNHNHNQRNISRHRHVRVDRRPSYVNNGYYHFNNGHRVRYSRPIINVRYTNYARRPVVLVENYERVPGYVWVAGQWNWNGGEWVWISGHYAVDAAYAY